MNIKKVISILLFVVSFAMIGSGVYIMNSSKYMFETAISGVFDYLVDGYMEITDSLEEANKYEKYKMNTVNTVTLEGEEFASITGDMYINSNNSNFYLNLDSKIAGEDFLGMEALVANEKVYAKIKEAMDDFYYEEMEVTTTENLEEFDFTQLLSLEKNELETLTKHVKNSILKDVTDKDLIKTSETIKLDGKDYKTTKVTLNISEKRLGNIIENLLTSISEDNKAIQVLQKFNKTVTKESIQEMLNSFKEESSSFSDEEVFALAFYFEGFGSLRRIELSTIEGEVDSVATDKLAITIDTYNNKYNNKTYLLSVSEGETVEFVAKQEYTSKTNSNILIQLPEDSIEVSGTFEESESNITLNLSLIVDDETLGTLNYKDSVVTKDKEYKLELDIDVSGLLTISSVNTIFIGEEIPTVDVDNALSFDEMSEEDSNTLNDYINDKLAVLGLSGSDDDDYYDDYYEDDFSDYDDIYSEDDYYWDDEDFDLE